jgi:chromate reductase, NAD(P)H dehydrogenase (quinone)
MTKVNCMSASIRLVGLSGSLRKGSFNTLLLHAAQELLPDDVTMDIVSIDLPLYNADLDMPAVKERPSVVQQFRDQLTNAHGLVIVSPEYNYGIPGGLKNAIDWASRGTDSPLIGKPIAIMGATQSLWGTVRMQLDFLNIILYLNMKPVYKPEVLVAQAQHKFDDKGRLTDDTSKDLVRKKLEALVAAIKGDGAL